MYDFILNIWFIYNEYDGNGRKNPKYIHAKSKKKFPVWLPSHPPVYEIGGRLFSGAKEPKTSRTYPSLDWDPNLQGWKKRVSGRGMGWYKQVIWFFYTYEFSRSSTKADWDTGLR